MVCAWQNDRNWRGCASCRRQPGSRPLL